MVGADGAVFGEVAAGLAHHPDGETGSCFAAAGAEEEVFSIERKGLIRGHASELEDNKSLRGMLTGAVGRVGSRRVCCAGPNWLLMARGLAVLRPKSGSKLPHSMGWVGYTLGIDTRLVPAGEASSGNL